MWSSDEPEGLSHVSVFSLVVGRRKTVLEDGLLLKITKSEMLYKNYVYDEI